MIRNHTTLFVNRVAFVSTLLLIFACGETPTETVPVGDIRAKLHGKAWSASAATARQYGQVETFEIGTTSPNPTDQNLQLVLRNIDRPGVYALGTGDVFTGGSATVSGGFITPLNGAAREVNITSVTSTRIAGTFKFRAKSRFTSSIPNPLFQYQLDSCRTA